MFTSKPQGRSQLLEAGIELSDAATLHEASASRTGSATERHSNSAPQPEPQRTDDHLEAQPTIHLRRGVTNKQLAAVGVAAFTVTSALIGTSIGLGVTVSKNNSLANTNKNLLNQNRNLFSDIDRAGADINELQSSVQSLTAANNQLRQAAAQTGLPAGAVPPVPGYEMTPPPPPPPPAVIDYAALSASQINVPESTVYALAATWNATSNPPFTEALVEKEFMGALSYQNVNVPLFGTGNVPSWDHVVTSYGVPAGILGNYNFTDFRYNDRGLAAATASLAAASPTFVMSLFANSVNATGDHIEYLIPLKYKAHPVAGGNVQVSLPVEGKVLTNGYNYVRGTGGFSSFNQGQGSINQDQAALWHPTLLKLSYKLADNGTYGLTINDALYGLRAFTGNEPEITGLTRATDAEGQYLVDIASDAYRTSTAMTTLPSENFDATIAKLALNSGARAGLIDVRDAFSLSAFEGYDSVADKVLFDGGYMEPALGANAVHVKTDDGAVNEILFPMQSYVFLGALQNAANEVTHVTIGSTSGVIDCDRVDQMLLAGGITSPVYGRQYPDTDVNNEMGGLPMDWATLPTKGEGAARQYHAAL